MPYMGNIAPRSDVEVRLLASDRNPTAASLSAGLGYGQVEAGVPRPVVAPGTSRSIAVTTGLGGMLRIHVEFEGGTGMGELEIRVNGAVRDVGQVKDDTWWMYAIEYPEPAIGGIGRTNPTVFFGTPDARQTPRD